VLVVLTLQTMSVHTFLHLLYYHTTAAGCALRFGAHCHRQANKHTFDAADHILPTFQM